MKEKISNFEIATLALYLLGNEPTSTDVEDIAIKANAIAPGRFAWRKYPDQIDIFRVSTALSDARKAKNGGYVLGSNQHGWILTEKGLTFASERVKDLEQVDLSRKAQSIQQRQWERNERARMLADAAFMKFQAHGTDVISVQEAEGFFRLNDYVVGQARERKIIRIVNTFGSDIELGVAVQALVDKIRGK